jgi:hypothetical protein
LCIILENKVTKKLIKIRIIFDFESQILALFDNTSLTQKLETYFALLYFWTLAQCALFRASVHHLAAILHVYAGGLNFMK